MQKKLLVDNIDAEDLMKMINEKLTPVIIEEVSKKINAKIDPYANIPDELSAIQVKSFFNISQYKINQAVECGLLSRKNIGKGNQKPTWRYFKDELINYVNKSR